jgi:hypothetical protein
LILPFPSTAITTLAKRGISVSAVITFDFGGGSATTNRVFIVLQQGDFVLLKNTALAAAISSGMTNLSVISDQIWISAGIGSELQGTLAAPIDWSSPQVPEVILNNLSNSANSPATVSWPTAAGVQTQRLTPGDPLELTGIIASGD